MLAAQAMLPVYFTIALYSRTYGVQALDDWLLAARRALLALVISADLINFVAFYTKSNDAFSRASVTLGLLFTASLLVLFRYLMAGLIAPPWGGQVKDRLVVDDGGSDFPIGGAVRSGQPTTISIPAAMIPSCSIGWASCCAIRIRW